MALSLVSPLSADALHYIEDLSAEITDEYPENTLTEKNNNSPDTWAEESYLLGKEAYNGIEINTTPSDEYLEKSRAACRRLALAGYRLADILNECFPE